MQEYVRIRVILATAPLKEDEKRDTFVSLNHNKRSGFDDISVNVLKQVYDISKGQLIYILKLPLATYSRIY